MSEILRSDNLSLDGYFKFVKDTLSSEYGSDWKDPYSGLITAEMLEFLFQHGAGSTLLMPEEFFKGSEDEINPDPRLRERMADELGDMLWFGFAVASQLGEDPKSLTEASLRAHTGQEPSFILTFSDLDRLAIENSDDIRVINKFGLLYPEAPVDYRHTSLSANPFYVLNRTTNRLTRALNPRGSSGPPVTSDLESISDLGPALGDYINSLSYIATTRLGVSTEEIAKANSQKIYYRQLWGKDVEVPVATLVAEHLHSTLYGKNDLISSRFVSHAEIEKDVSRPKMTERLTVSGQIDGKAARQTLTRDKRNVFHLSTVITGPEASVKTQTFYKKENPKALEAILDSLFMRKLIGMALDASGFPRRER